MSIKNLKICILLLGMPFISFSQKSAFGIDTMEFVMVVTDISSDVNLLHRIGCHKIYDNLDSKHKNIFQLSCDTIRNYRQAYTKDGINYYWERENYDLIHDDTANENYNRSPEHFRILKRLSGGILLGNYVPFKTHTQNHKIYYEFLKSKKSDFVFFRDYTKNGRTQIQSVLLKNKKYKIKGALPFFIHGFIGPLDIGTITYQKDTLLNYSRKNIDCYLFKLTTLVFCPFEEYKFYDEYEFYIEKRSLLPVITTQESFIKYDKSGTAQNRLEHVASSIILPVFKD